MHPRRHLFALGLALVLASPAGATGFARVGTFGFYWEGIFASGRLSALGGSDLTDGSPAALLVNPAPPGWENAAGLSYDHADYISGLDFRTLAGAASWNGLRVNFARQDLLMEPQLVRTAYNPEGTGETFEFRGRMTLIGLSYDMYLSPLKDSAFRWSFGLAMRRYLESVDNNPFAANTWDLGTTLSWRADYPGGWTRLTGAVSLQNVTDADFTFDERQTKLPRPNRTGLTAETALKRPGRADDLVKFMVAYTRTENVGWNYRADSDHTGLEVLFLGAVALRYGHSTRVNGGIKSYGLGVILDQRLLGPITVEMDLGTMNYDDPLFGGSKTIWGARARYDF